MRNLWMQSLQKLNMQHSGLGGWALRSLEQKNTRTKAVKEKLSYAEYVKADRK